MKRVTIVSLKEGDKFVDDIGTEYEMFSQKTAHATVIKCGRGSNKGDVHHFPNKHEFVNRIETTAELLEKPRLDTSGMGGNSFTLIEKDGFELSIDYSSREDIQGNGWRENGEVFSLEMGSGFVTGRGNYVNVVINSLCIADLHNLRFRINEVLDYFK